MFQKLNPKQENCIYYATSLEKKEKIAAAASAQRG